MLEYDDDDDEASLFPNHYPHILPFNLLSHLQISQQHPSMSIYGPYTGEDLRTPHSEPNRGAEAGVSRRGRGQRKNKAYWNSQEEDSDFVRTLHQLF